VPADTHPATHGWALGGLRGWSQPGQRDTGTGLRRRPGSHGPLTTPPSPGGGGCPLQPPIPGRDAFAGSGPGPSLWEGAGLLRGGPALAPGELPGNRPVLPRRKASGLLSAGEEFIILFSHHAGIKSILEQHKFRCLKSLFSTARETFLSLSRPFPKRFCLTAQPSRLRTKRKMEGHQPACGGAAARGTAPGGGREGEAGVGTPKCPPSPRRQAGGPWQSAARAERRLGTLRRAGPAAAARCSIVWNIKWKLIHTVNLPPASPPPAPRASLIEWREANEVRAHLRQTRTQPRAARQRDGAVCLAMFSIPARNRSLKTSKMAAASHQRPRRPRPSQARGRRGRGRGEQGRRWGGGRDWVPAAGPHPSPSLAEVRGPLGCSGSVRGSLVHPELEGGRGRERCGRPGCCRSRASLGAAAADAQDPPTHHLPPSIPSPRRDPPRLGSEECSHAVPQFPQLCQGTTAHPCRGPWVLSPPVPGVPGDAPSSASGTGSHPGARPCCSPSPPRAGGWQRSDPHPGAARHPGHEHPRLEASLGREHAVPLPRGPAAPTAPWGALGAGSPPGISGLQERARASSASLFTQRQRLPARPLVLLPLLRFLLLACIFFFFWKTRNELSSRRCD